MLAYGIPVMFHIRYNEYFDKHYPTFFSDYIYSYFLLQVIFFFLSFYSIKVQKQAFYDKI